MPGRGAGLYIHVPFCAHRCHYCDFNTYAPEDLVSGADADRRFEALTARYVDALCAELAMLAERGPAAVAPRGVSSEDAWPAIGSVFVGGGTPTLLPSADLARVLELARRLLPVTTDAEITVEANPETVDAVRLGPLVDVGVTRLSMGAQSFADHVLDSLGRRHTADRPLRAVAAARTAGIERLNLDLIYGSPFESDSDWEATVASAIASGVDHVSAYALTVEAGTPYAARIRRGQAAPPDEDVQAARMQIADERLTAAGLHRYELSNWARPGEECRHNLLYWRGGSWLAAGAGAHGHWAAGDRGRRWWNVRPVPRYVETVLAGDLPLGGDEVVSGDAYRTERLMMGLRLSAGVARRDVEPLDEPGVAAMMSRGLLVDDGAQLRLTSAGMPLANAVILRLLPDEQGVSA